MTELEFDVGRAVPFHVARDPVNLPVIRRWCDAMGDRNPVHTDKEVAARSRFGRIVAPLAMLDVWTNPGFAYERDTSDVQGAAFETLDRAGFTSAVAVNSELAQERPLVLGDELRSTVMLESVSAEKSTAIGAGHFVTTCHDFTADGEPVGHKRFTVFKFRPTGDRRTGSASSSTTDPAAEGGDGAAAPARDALGTVLAGSLDVADPVPLRAIALTTTLVVSGALMTSDYFEAHHDRDAAIRRGSQDVFMNIHTTLGLIEAWLSEWLGPNARWRSMSVQLGTTNYPGDVMTLTGDVATIDAASGATTLAVRATNALGTHAHGAVEIELPTS
ncbi:MAG: MaoC family dehydratase N-terminal domain-containing protein [Acidimicrobiia bacterium]